MIRKTIDIDFDIGDIVYHKTNTDRVVGIVVQLITDDQGVMYLVTWEGDLTSSRHYGFELTSEYVKRWLPDEPEE
jgi:hypothetical protein